MPTNLWNPEQLLKTSGSYWMGCTLHASVKLEIYSLIGETEKTVSQISTLINADTDATTRLLDALVAMGLLTKKKNRYANTPESAIFLQKSSPKYIGYMIMHHHHLIEGWSKLDQAVTTGKSVRKSASHADDEIIRESFLMGMFNNAMNLAPLIVKQVDLSHKKHLLDLGGGPGTYGIHFCMRNQNLKATIYDLPTTQPFAEKIIERFEMKDRIIFIGGNFIKNDIPDSYDVVWLSHILHGEGPTDCEKLIAKAVSSLVSGGLILIHDFILNDTMDGPVFPALFSLNMLIGTEKGRAYSDKEIRNMMVKAGVGNIRRIKIDIPNDSSIIAGDKM
jgi:predicted O-methyltransferase YrrM